MAGKDSREHSDHRERSGEVCVKKFAKSPKDREWGACDDLHMEVF